MSTDAIYVEARGRRESQLTASASSHSPPQSRELCQEDAAWGNLTKWMNKVTFSELAEGETIKSGKIVGFCAAVFTLALVATPSIAYARSPGDDHVDLWENSYMQQNLLRVDDRLSWSLETWVRALLPMPRNEDDLLGLGMFSIPIMNRQLDSRARLVDIAG